MREFGPLLSIPAEDGLIIEATYNNAGTQPVNFGLTTEDEMFVTYLHYTVTDPATSVEELPISRDQNISVFPNPSNGNFEIQFELEERAEVKFELYNLLGEKVAGVSNSMLGFDEHTIKINASDQVSSNGIYLLTGTIGNKTITHRIFSMN